MLYEVITGIVPPPGPPPGGGSPGYEGPACGTEVFRGRVPDVRHRGRITSYNVCYTKLLRGQGVSAAQRVRVSIAVDQDDLVRGGQPGYDIVEHPRQRTFPGYIQFILE